MISFESNLEELSEVAVLSGVELTDAEIEQTSQDYEAYRAEADGPVLLGIYGEDLRRTLKDLGSIIVKNHVTEAYTPLLVPISDLEWYNLPYLKEAYGETTPLYCYVHPEPEENPISQMAITDAITGVLDEGAVILYDQYQDEPALMDLGLEDRVPDADRRGIELISRGSRTYELESLGARKVIKKDNIFIGEIAFNDVEDVETATPILEVYEQAVLEGALEVDRHNGASMEAVMSDEDVEKVWDIYRKPFERLSKGHPMLAGFDEETLKATLLDPEVVKVVNRQDGEITTVAVFTTDFAHCPWFNEEHYKANYAEYYETGNVLMCPGIVSDQERRGHTFSWSLVDLMMKTLALRGSNILLTFECTEISTRYIPEKVVKRGIEESGVGSITGIDAPASTIDYKALRKV